MRIKSDKRKLSIILISLIISLIVTTPVALANVNSTLTYDANGNRIQGFGYYFEYNNFNQLTKVRNGTASGPIIEEYTYDHEGNRVLKFEPQKGQTTYYFGKRLVRVVNSSGTFDTLYIYDEKDLIARKELWHNKTFYYYPDHLGSTSVVVNETGAVVEETTYEPFGKVSSGGSDRFLYTSKELDTGTGLEYYGARYYDPAKASQFITPDSVIADIYDPQNLNRYSYVLNNPYAYTDPSGNSPVLTTEISVGLVILTVIGAMAFSAKISEMISTLGSLKFIPSGGPAATGGNQPANSGVGPSGGSGSTPNLPTDSGNNPSLPSGGGPSLPGGSSPNTGQGGYNMVTQASKSNLDISKVPEHARRAQEYDTFKVLESGRVRYYKYRSAADSTRSGANIVTEVDATTGKALRTWQESYDNLGRVAEVHPKTPFNLGHFMFEPSTGKFIGWRP